MSLSRFHPAVRRWFTDSIGEPTPAQCRGWEAIRHGRHTLIAAPTGSGKTLAAFLGTLDDLFQEGLGTGRLPDEVRVVYVSPLKALSADIHRNLAEPRTGIKRVAREMGLEAPRLTAAVRTGDTPQAERAAMVRTPPHILVTTPESLYLLLTAARTRDMLRTVRTVIVDEIHAVIGSRRGAHLALSLERLERAAEAPFLRLGLSATQKPIEEVARYLVGTGRVDARGRPDCIIVDEGHRREMDLALELPGSALESVMAHEVWEEYYERLTQLIGEHKTTIVFVNTRRMAERVARHLSDRLGDEAVTAHHGSLSKEKRFDAEERLKTGRLKALVATASLELGIDIGHIDLVCQIGSPHWISTFLQRVGRSGHTVRGRPKGRLFPTSRDDLVESAALLRSVGRGELDRFVMCDGPLDVLAQQIVAESACAELADEELFALVRRAFPYRSLERRDFDEVVRMVADGFATRRGRRGALVHHDEVNGRIRGRRGARLAAITSGGAIPENADYRVVLDPEDTFIGTLNEDFAIESLAGDVFQLGNNSWRILQVSAGTVRVQDAHGQPPTIPFWLGEAPARSAELSAGVSELRRDVEERLAESGREPAPDEDQQRAPAIDWLASDAGISRAAADQIVTYLFDAQRVLGVLPTQKTIVLERFFDESGGMQLVLHAPFGSRVNRAWGLALRKRFCRQFNFELQAAATEEGLLLSLGPQHSFPLADVFRYLHPATLKDILIQAFLDAPVFQTRWRWNTTISLAVLRNRAGKKVPPQLQRMQADDLMAAVFPDAAACLENIPGDREIPDHPLVSQTIRDCLEEAMDLPQLTAILTRIHSGAIQCVSRDTPEPSPLCHEILNARPYAFLDDAPLEERRTQAVYARRANETSSAGDVGALDGSAIERAKDEAWPDVRDADELHDALLTAGYLTAMEGARGRDIPWTPLFDALARDRRAACVTLPTSHVRLWVAAERLPEVTACGVGPATILIEPPVAPPERRANQNWTRERALVELLRGRLSILGPTTTRALAESLGTPEAEIDAALLALEQEGMILRGRFTPGVAEQEWCDRRLLARIHRYTLNRLRAEIEPASPAEFTRFLFAWQKADPAHRVSGIDGARSIILQLDGFEAPAGAWERHLLSTRMDRYEPSMLDMLCLTGQVGWGRLSATRRPSSELSGIDGDEVREGAARTSALRRTMARATPVAIFLREHADAWHALRTPGSEYPLGAAAGQVLAAIDRRGALFFHELLATSGLAAPEVEQALGELVAAGIVTSDGFAGMRAMIGPLRTRAASLDAAGRWSICHAGGRIAAGSTAASSARAAHTSRLSGPGAERSTLHNHQTAESVHPEALETQARALLRRYGVVFRRLLARETNAAPWRELARIYRRLEARGEVRGGRFVSGMSGEQFALADAVTSLRDIRRTPPGGQLMTISAADPLNLAGIITAGDRVPALTLSRCVYRDGVPLAAMEGDYVRPLTEYEPALAAAVAEALAGRPVPAVVRGYLGRVG